MTEFSLSQLDEKLTGLVKEYCKIEGDLAAAFLVDQHRDLLLHYLREGAEDVYNALIILQAKEPLEELCWLIAHAMAQQHERDFCDFLTDPPERRGER